MTAKLGKTFARAPVFTVLCAAVKLPKRAALRTADFERSGETHKECYHAFVYFCCCLPLHSLPALWTGSLLMKKFSSSLMVDVMLRLLIIPTTIDFLKAGPAMTVIILVVIFPSV